MQEYLKEYLNPEKTCYCSDLKNHQWKLVWKTSEEENNRKVDTIKQTTMKDKVRNTQENFWKLLIIAQRKSWPIWKKF